MKKILSAIIVLFFVTALNAQTVFWTEAFQNSCSSGCLATSYTTGPNGPWTVTTISAGAAPNQWFISGAECGDAPPNCSTVGGCGTTDPSLHIGANPNSYCTCFVCSDPAGDCGAAYDDCDPSFNLCGGGDPSLNARAESPDINTTAVASTITLSFGYIEGGQGTQDDALVEYSINGGSTWNPLTNPAKTVVCGNGQGQWTAFSFALPATCQGIPNLKIGFRWQCTAEGGGADPSFAVDDITLSIPGGAAPVASFTTSTTTVCASQCVTFTDVSTNSPTSWSWNFQGGSPATATTQTACVTYSASGTYTASLTATNSNGSGSTTQTVTITLLPLPTANAGSDVTICQSANTTLSASGGGTYLWSPTTGLSNPNISNPVASPTITTTYSVTVTNSCGSSTDDVMVTVNPLPTANAGSDITTCPGTNVTLTATGGGTYAWNTGATTASISVSPTATTGYTVTVTNSCGSNSDSVTIVISNTIVASISGNTTICPGQSTTLTASGGNNYSWNTTATTAAITVSPTATTSYTVYVSSGTCADTVATTVTLSSPPSASVAGGTTICAGDAATLTASGGNSYSWITGAQTTTSITVSPSSTTTYSVIASIGSCADTASATVTVNALPSVTIAGSASICAGDAATLTATGGGTYAWNTGQTSASIVVSPTATTNYSVTVTGTNGCTASASGNVSVISAVNASVSGNLNFCQGQGTTLCASGGCTYSWTTGETTSCISATTAGNYSVYASCGSCADTTSASVTVNPNPIAGAASDTTITQGQSANLTASGGGNYSWTTGSTNSAITVSPSVTTAYCVTVTNASGCTDTACATVTIDVLDCGDIFVPNAFSPNSDGQNELECVLGSCIKTFSFSIYDRWGEKVFTTDNQKICWDGTYKGKLMNTAEFVYFLEATLTNGEKKSMKGNISLIR